MNAITYNPIFSQVAGVSGHGLESKAGSVPPANSFAALLSGMIDPQNLATQSQVGQTLTLDGLLAQIDQLLAQLTYQQGDQEELGDQLDEGLLSDTSLQMIPAQDFVNMINLLFGPNGNVLGEVEGFTSLLPNSNSPQFNNVSLLSSMAEVSNQKSSINVQQMLHTALAIQPVQQQLLQSMKTIVLAVKEGQLTLTQDELGKLSRFLDQLSTSQSQKLELQRGLTLGEHKSLLFKGSDAHSFTRVVAPISDRMVNQSGSQLSQQESLGHNVGETSNSTTKAGFHQMMMGNIQSTIQPSSQAEINQPVVRAQHFQTDMNDFLVRQLQMTRLPNGVSEARIKLFPENLGSVEVKLTVQQGVLTAQFMAETRAGKELLESHLAGLRASLISSGLQVDKLEVNMPHNPNNGQAQDSMYRQGSDQRNQQAHGEDVHLEDESEEDFSTVFEQFSQAI